MERLFTFLLLLAAASFALGVSVCLFLDVLAGIGIIVLPVLAFGILAFLLRVEDDSATPLWVRETLVIAGYTFCVSLAWHILLGAVWVFRAEWFGLRLWQYLLLGVGGALVGALGARIELHWLDKEDLNSIRM